MIAPELKAEIRRLFFAEHFKIGTIADGMGISWDTVRQAIGSSVFNRTRFVRPSLTEPYLGFIKATLERFPRLRATRLHRMLAERGFTGSVRAVRRVVAELRPVGREAFLRRVTLPGEEAQVDWASFGEVDVEGTKRRLSCFLMVLSYSRALYLEFAFDQKMESFLRGHVHAFEAFGGVPRVLMYDNLRSAVLDRVGDAIRFHPRLLELAGHYHFAPRPCAVAAAHQKGRVERAVRYVRDAFYAARPFRGLAALNEEAHAWQEEVALSRGWPQDPSRTVAAALAEERSRLLPLPAHPFPCDLVTPIRSGKTPYVRFEANDYSIPAALAGRWLTLVASLETVRILDGQTEVAVHRRSFGRTRVLEDPAHLAPLLAERRKAEASSRAGRLLRAAPSLQAFLAAAVDAGERLRPTVLSLERLLDQYGPDALRAAAEQAVARGTPRAPSVAFLLSRTARPRPAPVTLTSRPDLAGLVITPASPAIYEELTRKEEDDV
jgi:transposase